MESTLNQGMETYYFALALMENEDISISDDDLLLLAEDYADIKHITSSYFEE